MRSLARTPGRSAASGALPGWERSHGEQDEKAYADNKNKHWFEAIKLWPYIFKQKEEANT
jgi:hypothetical protein